MGSRFPTWKPWSSHHTKRNRKYGVGIITNSNRYVMSLKATCKATPAISTVVQVWLSYPHVLCFFCRKKATMLSWSSTLRRFSSCPTACFFRAKKLVMAVVPLRISQPCGDISTKPPAVTSETQISAAIASCVCRGSCGGLRSLERCGRSCRRWDHEIVSDLMSCEHGSLKLEIFGGSDPYHCISVYIYIHIYIYIYIHIYIYTIGDNWRIWSVKFGSSPFEMGRLTKCEHWAPRWMNIVSFLKPYLEGFLPTSSFLKKTRPRGICLWNFIVGNPRSKNHHSSWKIEIKVMSLPSGNLTWLSKLTGF